MGQLRWLGASSERDYINPNDFLRIALFWEASVQPTRNYQIQLRLVDESGQVRLESVNQPSHNRYPTREWSAGERVRDNHAWWIPADFPAGRYRLELNLLDETARPLGAWQVVGEMSLTQ
jgi:hypothetical protein